MTMNSTFQRVMLYVRQLRVNQDVLDTLQQVITYLKARQQEIYFDQDTADSCDFEVPVLARQELNQATDLIIVVGGDGSLLSAARIATQRHIPVIGINRGCLGFLTDISPQSFDSQLDKVLKGYYSSESRSLLAIAIRDAKHTYFEAIALNDVVLSRGNETRLISFDVYIDDLFVSHYRADGLILATPTGSTAYALSAGGPIMHPQLHAIVMVPMFSHSLSARPLVIDSNSRVVLHLNDKNEMPLQISCDGHDSYAIAAGQCVYIHTHATPLRLLHPSDYHYYDTLRIKLGWGSKG